MNKDVLLERKKALQLNVEETQANITQLVANINAISGAIQEVDYWLEKLEEVVE